MDKFIKFGENVFNTRYIVAIGKCKKETYVKLEYGIEIYTTNDVDRQWFNEEYERDSVFNQISRDLLNE